MPTTSETAESVVQQLMQRGCFVELKISRWSGRAPLEEADLGLRRQLVPAEELAKIGCIASRARARLEDASHAFPITGGRFVPSAVLGTLLADLKKCRDDFTAAVAAFAASYETLAEQTRAAWRENAERACRLLRRRKAWARTIIGSPTAYEAVRAESMRGGLVPVTLAEFRAAPVVPCGGPLMVSGLDEVP